MAKFVLSWKKMLFFPQNPTDEKMCHLRDRGARLVVDLGLDDGLLRGGAVQVAVDLRLLELGIQAGGQLTPEKMAEIQKKDEESILKITLKPSENHVKKRQEVTKKDEKS